MSKFDKNKAIILYYNQDEEDFKLVGYYNKRIKPFLILMKYQLK